jgi:hypothetical protein
VNKRFLKDTLVNKNIRIWKRERWFIMATWVTHLMITDGVMKQCPELV